MASWMITYTGRKINPLDPNPDDIDIRDIAHHLSFMVRYHGACKFFYSVGQHSVIGSHFVLKGNKLAFLLHDGSEAYLHDIVKGVKEQLPGYKCIEEKLQALIYWKFGVGVYNHAEIKKVDYAIMNTEAHILISNLDGWEFPEPPLTTARICYIEPNIVEEQFLMLFEKYTTYNL